MSKPEWGRKLTCTSCGVKFYDLQRNPAPCPACGAENDPLQTWKPKRARAAARPRKEEAAAPGETEDALPGGDDAALEGDSGDKADEDIMEDASDLGGDDDDMSEVAEHMETDGGDKD